MARRSLIEHFADLPDPRIDRTKKHRLDDLLVIALCAILCRAETFEDIELSAECREEWLRSFLRLPHGIPSHDTVYRVFCALDAKVFAACFGRWMADLSATLGLKPIAIDGKARRWRQHLQRLRPPGQRLGRRANGRLHAARPSRLIHHHRGAVP